MIQTNYFKSLDKQITVPHKIAKYLYQIRPDSQLKTTHTYLAP